MPKSSLILLGILFSIVLHAQNLSYSRAFPTVSKNLPLQIFKNEDSSFFLLRFNKKAHDLTLEKRSMFSAEILQFTALRLDSVNSNIFDYSNLEYKFINYLNQNYFVFEKSTNQRKTLYFKHINSLGKSSGFIEIAHLERENTWLDFDFEFNDLGKGQILIVSKQKYINQSVKKQVTKYDLTIRKKVWTKILAIENASTGNSQNFCVNPFEELFYLMVKPKIVSYLRKYSKHQQLVVPELIYDTLQLLKLSADGTQFQRKSLQLQVNNLHSSSLFCDSNNLYFFAQVTASLELSPIKKIVLISNKGSFDFEKRDQSKVTVLQDSLLHRLMYYDGTDSNLPSDKFFTLLDETQSEKHFYCLTERKEEDVYKELLLWQIRLSDGGIENQYLIPRRILSSDAWSRYSNIGEAISTNGLKHYFLFVAEAPSNSKSNPNTDSFYYLRKRSSLSNCNLIFYEFKDKNTIHKRILHQNKGFNFIPIKFQAVSSTRMVFYLTNGKQEKFAFMDLRD